MKLAVLIQCHKAPQQINILLDAMQGEGIDCFVHVDKKSDINNQIISRSNVILIPDNLRVDVQWGQFSQVQATLNLLSFAKKFGNYDFYCLISGQDFPIVSARELCEYLSEHKNNNFVNLFTSKNNGLGLPNNYDKRNDIVFPQWLMARNLFTRILRRLWVALTGGYNHTYKLFKRRQINNIDYYFGPQWWCVNNKFAGWLLTYLEEHRQFIDFFKKSSCPDESFFQTLLMNSPFADTRCDYLHYVDWSEGKNSPKNLTVSDYDKIISSGKFFARKIDGNIELIQMLKRNSSNIIEGK